MINQELLVEYLQASLDPNQKDSAELKLKQLNEILGFSSTLLQIIVRDDNKMPIRQAAAIYFKNYVKNNWSTSTNEKINDQNAESLAISENDKNVIKENIIEAMIYSPEILRSQLSICVSTIIKHDFPHNWVKLIEKFRNFLVSNDINAFMGGLLCLHQLAKNYEYKRTKEREPLYTALEELLPLMSNKFNQLFLDNEEPSLNVQKQIFKTIYCAIQFQLPPQFMNHANFSRWMQIFLTALNNPIPNIIDKLDNDDKAASVWWKCKKWVLHILCRIFERYGSPLIVSKEYKEFAQYYMITYTATIITTILKFLESYRLNAYVSPRVLQFSFAYLTDCVSPSFCWKLMKPQVQILLRDIIFKILKYSDDDAFQWENDPIEYIRTKFDFYEDFISPITAAKNLTFAMCHRRQGVVDDTLALCVSSLQQSSQGGVVYQNEDSNRNIDGALNVIGTLADILCSRPSFKDQIEPFVINYIFPNFSHPKGYLRARACWLIYQFKSVKYSPEAALKVVQTILTLLLKDSDLPVKVEACIALKTLASRDETAKQALIPHLKEIITELLNVVHQSLNEEMTTILKDFVDLYSEFTKPLALDMVNQTYFILQSVEDKKDDEEIRMFVSGLLEVIEIIIEMLDENKVAIQLICPQVIMIIRLVLEKFHCDDESEDFYDEIISTIYALTSFTIPSDAWQLLPFLYQIFLKDKESFFTEMLPIWHNFITIDTEAFLSHPSHLELTYTMCKEVIQGDNDEDMQLRAVKLLEVILFQCHNMQDKLIPPILDVVIARLFNREIATMEFKLMNLQIIIASLFLNPRLTFEKMAEIGSVLLGPTEKPLQDRFIEMWFENIDLFYGLHDNKVCLFGLCTLLRLPPELRPKLLSDKYYTKIVPAITKRMDEIMKINQAMAKISESSWEDADDTDDDSSVSFKEPLQDDQDDIDEQKQKYLQAVSPSHDSSIIDTSVMGDGEMNGSGLVNNHQSMCPDDGNIRNINDSDHDAGGQDIDDDDDDDEEETVLDSYTSIVDQNDSPLNEYIIFKSAIENLQSQDAILYNTLFSSLNAKDLNLFKEIYQKVETKILFGESTKKSSLSKMS